MGNCSSRKKSRSTPTTPSLRSHSSPVVLHSLRLRLMELKRVDSAPQLTISTSKLYLRRTRREDTADIVR